MNAAGGIVAQGPSNGPCAPSAGPPPSTICAAPSSPSAATCRCCSAMSPTFVEAAAVRRGVAHRLKGEVVSARVTKQFGADTVEVAAGIRAAVEDIRRSLPTGVQLRIVYDQSVLVNAALGGVGRAVMLGGVFVVLVILLLLGNVRAALARDADHSAVHRAGGTAAQATERRPEHDDARRSGHRRRPAR